MTLTALERSALESALHTAGHRFTIQSAAPCGGGCIHRSYALASRGQRLFAKLNSVAFDAAFSAEADGLRALAGAGIRAPEPVCHGRAGGFAFLVMEYLELGASGNFAELGTRLAAMHSVHGERHGWHCDNFIGSTPQRNPETRDWVTFWREARLLPQLKLARRNGFAGRLQERGERIAADLARLIRGYAPPASLLHGDLWQGNAAFLAGDVPVVFDPAVYRGDRETDLAMTELFGGFPAAFYRAYRQAAPLDAGYAVRKHLYNLYHVLNHLNLFGGSYLRQAESMMERLLSEV